MNLGLGLDLFASAPAAFDPSKLSNLLAWYRADSNVTTVSGKISAWGDKSGSGDANRNLAQATAGLRPTFSASVAALNNQPAALFVAGSDTSLASGIWSSPAPYAQPVTLCTVVSFTSSPGAEFLCDDIDGSSRVVLYTNNDTQWHMFAGSDAFGGAIAASTPYALVGIFNGLTSKLYVSALTPVLAGNNAGTNALKSLRLGVATNGTSDPLDGYMPEFVAVDGALSSTDIGNVLRYFGTRYGITIGP